MMTSTFERKKSILLVEDEIVTAIVEQQELQNKGYEVKHVDSGEKSLAAALDENSKIDLILMDIDLGKGMDGTQAAEEILKIRDIPIVFLSSHTEPEIVEKTEKITSYGYVVKNSGSVVLDASIKMAFRLFEAKTLEKEKSKALRNTNQLLETIFNNTHIMFAYLDLKFNFVRVNEAYALADEKEPSYFPGRNHFDMYPNDENKTIFQRVVDTGKAHFSYAKPFEYAEHPERGVTHWDWSLVLVKNQKGRIEGLILALLNVTERIKAEEAFRDSERQLKTLFENTPDIIVRYDRNLRHVFVNKAYDLLGRLSAGNLIGKTLAELGSLPAEQIKWSEDIIRGVFDTGKPVEFETSLPGEDGIILLNSRGIPEFDETGNIQSVLFIHRNITESKKMESDLGKEKEFMQKTMDSMVDTYFVFNPRTGEAIRWNKAFERVSGYTHDEIVKLKAPESYYGSEDLEKARQSIDAIFKNSVGTVELELICKNGEKVPYEYAVSLIYNDKNEAEYFISIGRDVRGRKGI